MVVNGKIGTAMTSSTASVARLGLAIHSAVPSAIFSVGMNSIVTNKTYRPLKLVGDVLPSKLRTALRRAYVVANGVFVIGVIGFLWWHCTDAAVDAAAYASQERCLPATSLVAIALLVFLWIDRGTLALLHAPGTDPTFATRCARGACCAGFLMAISEHDPSMRLFLTLALFNRYSGSVSWASKLRIFDRVVRVGVSLVAMYAIYSKRSSQRLAAMTIACAIHSR